MNLRANLSRFTEIVAFILLLVAVPVAVIGLVLPINEYSWMANDGSAPPGCDIVTGTLLFPIGIAFLAGFLGFGLLILRRRSKLPLIGLLRVAGVAVPDMKSRTPVCTRPVRRSAALSAVFLGC